MVHFIVGCWSVDARFGNTQRSSSRNQNQATKEEQIIRSSRDTLPVFKLPCFLVIPCSSNAHTSLPTRKPKLGLLSGCKSSSFVCLLVVCSCLIVGCEGQYLSVSSDLKLGSGTASTPLSGASLASGDGFGKSVSRGDDVNGDGVRDVCVGAGGDNGGRGAVYLMFLNEVSHSVSVKSYTKIAQSSGGFAATLNAGDWFGNSCSLGGDINGDGVPDLVVGAFHDNSRIGAVYVIMLWIDGYVKSFSKISSTTGSVTPNLSTDDQFGTGVSFGPDMDGDGIRDICVGSSGFNSYTGAAYIVYLNQDGSAKKITKISADATTKLTNVIVTNDQFGFKVSIGPDLNQDGYVDVAVGIVDQNDGCSRCGAAMILFMGPSNSSQASIVKSYAKISMTSGGFTAALQNLDEFGYDANFIDDMNFDGIPDLVVGAFGVDDSGTNTGAAFIIFLSRDGTVKSHQRFSASTAGLSSYISSNDAFGSSVYAEKGLIIAGAIGTTGSTGAVHFIQLQCRGYSDACSTDINECTFNTHNCNHTATCTNTVGSFLCTCYDGYIGDGVSMCKMVPVGSVYSNQKISSNFGFNATLAAYDYFGSSVSVGGDVNGDGFHDLLIGSPGYHAYHASGDVNIGAVYLLFMNRSRVGGYSNDNNNTLAVKSFVKIGLSFGGFTAVLSNYDAFGSSCALGGDINNDTIPDIVVGAPHDGTGGTGKGCIYVMFLDANGYVKSFNKIVSNSSTVGPQIADGSAFGSSVSIGPDLNADGIIDIVAGSPLDNDGGSAKGSIWILYMNMDGSLKSSLKICSSTTSILSSAIVDNDQFGTSVSIGPDLNGDGIPDVIVGSTNQAILLFLDYPNQASPIKSIVKIVAPAALGLSSSNPSFGSSVMLSSDLNKDGISDILVGAPSSNVVVVMFMAQNGSIKSFMKSTSPSPTVTTLSTTIKSFGSSVWVDGSMTLNGNTTATLIVGSALTDESGLLNTGSVHVVNIAVNDRCQSGTHNCHSNSICTNTASSFTCTCNAGYSGDGVQSCNNDINECLSNLHNCDVKATCLNTVGTFTCSCNTGYTGNGVGCSNINECTSNTHNCNPHATCSDTTASFTCSCNAGYNGNGTSCADINECTSNTHNCNANSTCTNTPGSFICPCNANYYYHASAASTCVSWDIAPKIAIAGVPSTFTLLNGESSCTLLNFTSSSAASIVSTIQSSSTSITLPNYGVYYDVSAICNGYFTTLSSPVYCSPQSGPVSMNLAVDFPTSQTAINNLKTTIKSAIVSALSLGSSDQIFGLTLNAGSIVASFQLAQQNPSSPDPTTLTNNLKAALASGSLQSALPSVTGLSVNGSAVVVVVITTSTSSTTTMTSTTAASSTTTTTTLTSTSSPSSATTTSTPSTTAASTAINYISSSPPIGAIIGGVVGGLGGLTLIGIIAYHAVKKWRVNAPLDIAKTKFLQIYAVTQEPPNLLAVLQAVKSLILIYCRKVGVPSHDGEHFYQALEKASMGAEGKQNSTEMGQFATYMWTSALHLGATQSEFCSILQYALRQDDEELLKHACVIIRAINKLCVTRRAKTMHIPWPTNFTLYRGGSLPEEHKPFFTPGLKFRFRVFIASSANQATANRFMKKSDAPKVLWVISVDPIYKCVQANYVGHVGALGESEAEFLFVPYSVFTVTEASYSEQYGHYIINLFAAIDNLNEGLDLPLAPWY